MNNNLNNPVRFGIIGTGKISGLVSWVFREDDALQATAVADVNLAAAQGLADALGVEAVYDDYRKLLRDPQVDAVYIATPPFLHRDMVLEAIAADKHVICEKPFMLNPAQVREVVTASEGKPHLKVGCCSCRFHDVPSTRRARQMIAEEALGPLYRVTFEGVSPAWPPGTTLPAWRNDPAKNGGGLAFDWGVYDLDWLSYVLGENWKPHTLFAAMGGFAPLSDERRPPAPDVDGWLTAEILCDNGLSVHWERRAAEHGPPHHRVEMRGRDAGLDLPMIVEPRLPGLMHHAYRGAEPLQSELQPEAGPEWHETLVYPLRDLVAAIREDRAPASPPHRQLLVHAVLEALYASAQAGQSVPVTGYTSEVAP